MTLKLLFLTFCISLPHHSKIDCSAWDKRNENVHSKWDPKTKKPVQSGNQDLDAHIAEKSLFMHETAIITTAMLEDIQASYLKTTPHIPTPAGQLPTQTSKDNDKTSEPEHC